MIDPTPPKFPNIPSYTILSRIGGGAYGEVFLARTVTGLHRAVKVVSREDFDLEKTFEREFEGIKRYERVSQDHAGLVDVLHVGREPGADFYYYVMELADDESGETIDEIETTQYKARTLTADLRKNPVRDIDECISLGRSLAEALAHLHRAGLTHRDVKPSNIIFVKGEPRLADIGLVAQSGQRTYVGTEGYVPPEGPGTSSADLYSLAMVLYEMHTGKDRLDFPELPTNHELAPTVNRDEWRMLNTVICRSGSPDPRKRFESGLAFSEALRKIRPGADSGKRSYGDRRGDSFFGKLLVTTSVVGLLIAIGAALFLWKDLMFAGGTKTEIESPHETPGTKVAAVSPSPEPAPTNNDLSPGPVIVDPPSTPLTAEPVEPKPDPEPIVASLVEKTSRPIKLDSNPSGATIWFRGEDIGRTPTSFRDFELGELEFVFKMDGYLDKKLVTSVLEAGKPLPLPPVKLLNDLRPKPDQQTWENSILLPFTRQSDGTYLAAVTRAAYDTYFHSTGLPPAISSRPGVDAVQENDDAKKWAYCNWMTEKDRSIGYLDELEYYAPISPPEGLPYDSFYCRIDDTYGTLLIDSEPSGAAIYNGDDDDPIGQTPDTLDLHRGRFDLILRQSGYKDTPARGTLGETNALEKKTVTMESDGSVIFGELWSSNSQSMKLVPVGPIMVAIFETRKRDFDEFLQSDPTDGNFRNSIYFSQTPDHPVVGVSRDAAVAFCRWLTEKEQTSGQIRKSHHYRLPTDQEWSEMAGLPQEEGITPKERESRQSGKFPWGKTWPPPSDAGNFADQAATVRYRNHVISDYNDKFSETAPVGSFTPTKHGLFDLAGNAWEWVSDSFEEEEGSLGVVRGGGYDSYTRGVLLSSYRKSISPTTVEDTCGFRYILAETGEND